MCRSSRGVGRLDSGGALASVFHTVFGGPAVDDINLALP